ncbi:MAG TPA: hypothetical protein VMR34_03885 [Candidatus Saccharimonadales bacterium]|nr:hypothetical protein [Candidatus Saccharimonadales bacterium]
MATIYEQSMALQAHLDSVGEGIDRNMLARLGLITINDRWDSSQARIARSSSCHAPIKLNM